MAQVALSTVGAKVGGSLGSAVGRTVGSMIDRAVIGSLAPPREIGPRLTSLQVMSAAEGAPMPAVFGRARVAGQVIWAARFKAARIERRDGGGKGGPRTVEESYSLSFACALGEGPIDGVGRIWADGKPMGMAGVTMRVHAGGEDETPDPLIEAVEGVAPAYRGTAYAVFEDLPLGPYGNRVPQLSFEVFRRPRGVAPGLEERLTGVCLIPGAGEFVFATEPVLRREGLTRSKAENVNNTSGRPDLLVSLDQLAAQLPNVKSVTLVVSWFGDDLRAGVCQVRPGVEIAEKDTLPFPWCAGGMDRGGARVLSGADGRPTYGGTPADRTVVQAITELKRRGYAVTLYPFLMMDVRPGNGRLDPYGGREQAVFPWRGRVTCHPAPGRAGSPDGSGAAAAQVESFFGQASRSQFSVIEGEVRFGGSEWSWSRAVLHYARLAELAGGVDAFIIGSELRGLTSVRDGVNSYPGVRALKRLAGECRQVLRPETAISYAADWSEWFGHQPADGSGHVSFNLDPLWSDPAISFVGIDWYAPGADWRDAADHLDVLAGYKGPHDLDYLLANVAGREGFDWFYASDEDRSSQVRIPITDGAHGEPWVFRPKDLVGWWSNLHHDRPRGERSVVPTSWVPESKPIRLVEFGCPAVDKAANSPNLFFDPKSSESALPPFSDGSRDDLGQRRALEAVLTHFSVPANNPVSTLYGGPMVDGASAWCWDARPFPDFPGRPEVWADAPNWTHGHWLNGRTGVAPAAELLAAILARGGIGPEAVDLTQASGSVTGYVVDRPMSLREAVSPLLEVFALDASERDGRLTVISRDGAVRASLGDDDLAWPEGAEAPERRGRGLDERPTAARARFVDDAGEYPVASAKVSVDRAGHGGVVDLDLPVVIGRGFAERVAQRRLRRAESEGDDAVVHLSPEMALRLEPGDCVRLGQDTTLWRVVEVEADEAPTARLAPSEAPETSSGTEGLDWRPGETAETAGPPVLHWLDLPPLPGGGTGVEADPRPLVAAAGDPWRGMEILAGPSATTLTRRVTASEPASLGLTVSELPDGPLHRMHREGGLTVRIEGQRLQSRSWLEVSAGANALAVLHPSSEWEVLQFLDAELVGSDTYALGRLLRGQAGTEAAMAGPVPAGAPAVLLDGDLVRAEVSAGERGAPLVWRAAPPGAVHAVSTSQGVFTWRGLHARPWAPAHLRGRRTPEGGVELSWIRRARIGGDGWEGEPPLAEEREVYQVQVLSDGAAVRTWEVVSPGASYSPEWIAADFPGGSPAVMQVQVRQGSAVFGWGAVARRDMWLS